MLFLISGNYCTSRVRRLKIIGQKSASSKMVANSNKIILEQTQEMDLPAPNPEVWSTNQVQPVRNFCN